jgi:hypothetical protein
MALSGRLITIKKPGGGARQLAIPTPSAKARLRLLLRELEALEARTCGPWVHGCRRGHSAVTAALPHIGHPYTLSMDIASFFDSIRASHLHETVPRDTLELTLWAPYGRWPTTARAWRTHPCILVMTHG